MQEKQALGFFLSGHLFDEASAEVRQFAKTTLDALVDSRDPVLVAGVVSDVRVINGQRGKLIIFRLDDKSKSLEASVDEGLFNANKETLKDDELVILQAIPQPDRMSGGLRLKVQRVWNMAQARCRFGKHLRVEVRERMPNLHQLIEQHPPKREWAEEGERIQGLKVVLHVVRDHAEADIELDDRALLFPSEAAIQGWMAQAHAQQAKVVYHAN